jgi:hypothetical protein
VGGRCTANYLVERGVEMGEEKNVTLKLDEPICFDGLIKEEELKGNLNVQVEKVLDDISKMFRQKNKQYRTNNDDLANFTKGALMLGYEANEIGRFEALKGYVLKHISKVYNGTLDEDKMDESIMDIAVYFIIATVMHRRMEQANEPKNRE